MPLPAGILAFAISATGTSVTVGGSIDFTLDLTVDTDIIDMNTLLAASEWRWIRRPVAGSESVNKFVIGPTSEPITRTIQFGQPGTFEVYGRILTIGLGLPAFDTENLITVTVGGWTEQEGPSSTWTEQQSTASTMTEQSGASSIWSEQQSTASTMTEQSAPSSTWIEEP